MEKVIIFTNMPSIRKHWQNSLEHSYITGVLEILCQSDRIYNSKGLNNESNT